MSDTSEVGGRLRVAVVAVLVLDAVLLALTELAWLTLRTPGGVWVPVSVVAALVTTPLLVRAADRAVPRTRAPLAPLAGWTLAVVVVGVWSPSEVGTLPPDYRAIVLIAAGVLPGVFAAVWRPVRRPTPEPARGDSA